MYIFYVLGAYCLICGVVLYVLLLGQQPKHKENIVGKTNRCLRNLPGNCFYYLFLFGNCFSRRKAETQRAALEEYCYDKPNPFIQFFYCFLVSSSLYFFFDRVAPYLSEREALFTIAVCGVAMVCYLLAWLADPGTVATSEQLAKMTPAQREAERAQNERFGYDGLYYTRSPCVTCNVPKPARSKHCRVCGRCVRRFDHHCPWINTDVGENNLRYFHAFLISHVIMSAVVAWYSGVLVYRYIAQERLWFARYAAHHGKPAEAFAPSWYIVILYAMSQNTIPSALTLFAGIVAVLLAGFWWMNFMHVVRNETTNEMHKREDIVAFVKHMEEKEAVAKQQQQQQSHDDDDDGVANAVNQQQQHHEQQKKRVVPKVTRQDVARSAKFYREGASLWRNVVEVMIPSSRAAAPSAQFTGSTGTSSASSEKQASAAAKDDGGESVADKVAGTAKAVRKERKKKNV